MRQVTILTTRAYFSFAEFSGRRSRLRWIGLSTVLALAILLTDYRIRDLRLSIYALMLVVLAVTIVGGSPTSRFTLMAEIRASEPAACRIRQKVATALALAKLFNGYNFRLNASAGNYAKAIGIIVAPIFLIFLQKETGSALAYMALFFSCYTAKA